MNRKTIIQLWLCFSYFVVVFLVVASRAMWGFLRVASEYPGNTIPKEAVFKILSSVSHDLWIHTILIGIGILIFGLILVTIKPKKHDNKSNNAI